MQPQSPNLNLNTFVQETLWEDALPSPPDCSLCQETSQFPLLQIQDSQPIFCLPPGDHENEDSIHNTGDITDLSPLSFSQTFPTLFDQQVPQDDHSHFSRLSSSPMMAGERRQEGELFDVCTNEWAASEKIEAASDLMKRIGLSAYNDVFGKRVGAILLSKATMPIIFMCTPATANLWGYSHRDMLSIPWQKIMLKYNSMNVSTLRERVVAENKSKWRRSVMHLPPLRFLAVSKSGSVFEVSRRASLYFKVTDYDAELLYVHLTIYA